MSEFEEAAINNRSLRSRKHNRLEEDLDQYENLKRPNQHESKEKVSPSNDGLFDDDDES